MKTVSFPESVLIHHMGGGTFITLSQLISVFYIACRCVDILLFS